MFYCKINYYFNAKTLVFPLARKACQKPVKMHIFFTAGVNIFYRTLITISRTVMIINTNNVMV